MESKLSELAKLYKNKITKDKNYLKYSDIHNLDFYDTKKDDFRVSLIQRRLDLKYMICLIIIDKYTVLHVPIMTGDRNLTPELEKAKKELEENTLEDFLNIYYETMKKNLL